MNAPFGESRFTMLKGVLIEEAHKLTSVSWELHHTACLITVDDRVRLVIFTTASEMRRYCIAHPNHKVVARLG